jgi:hypothetical protein
MKSYENPMTNPPLHLPFSDSSCLLVLDFRGLLGSTMLHDVIEEFSPGSVPRRGRVAMLCECLFSHKNGGNQQKRVVETIKHIAGLLLSYQH